MSSVANNCINTHMFFWQSGIEGLMFWYCSWFSIIKVHLYVFSIGENLVDTFPVCQMMMTPLKTPCSSHVNDPIRMIEVTTWVLICWPFISRSWHCTNWYKTPCILVRNKLWHFFNPTNYLNMYIKYWINNSYKTLYVLWYKHSTSSTHFNLY